MRKHGNGNLRYELFEETPTFLALESRAGVAYARAVSEQNAPDTPSVENEPGQRSGSGSDSLRQHLEGDARRKALPSARRPVARDKLRILVVDDNAAMRYALVRGLQAEGFATAEAADGTEGLRLAPAASALVLDIHLPDIDGIEVCRLLRAKPSTAAMPIVHVSAVHMDKEVLVDSVKAGADAFLVGPVDPQTLAGTLESLLEAADWP